MNNTEENYARPRQKQETEKHHEGQHTALTNASENDMQTKRLTRSLNKRNTDRKQMSNKHFQDKDDPEPRVTDDASQIKAKDLKKRKIKRIFL